MGSKRKELSIETLRGFAIIFMVAGHVIGGSSDNGMRVADDSGWRYFYFTFEYLRMPLFTVISGYVYSLWPIGNSRILSFLKGKGRRILLPLVSVGTIHFLIQHFVPGTNAKYPLSDLWRIYIFPYEHFWFLQSIFLIFVLIAVLDHFKLIVTFRKWLIVFLIAALIRTFILPFPGNFFSINGFLNLLPFFLLGCGIKRFENIFSGKETIKLSLIVFVISVFLQQFTWFSNIKLNFFEFNLLSICVACPGIIVLFYIRKDITIISKIGYYAFGIYLFHVFGAAGSRIFLGRFGIDYHLTIFTSGLILGLGVPIIIELILEKSTIMRRLFLGLR